MIISTEKLAYFFAMADRAKRHRNYEIANLVFAVIAERVLLGVPLPVSVMYEVSDDCDTYYDLAAFSFAGMYLCIPVTLLRQDAWLGLVSRAELVDRAIHDRQYARDNEEVPDFTDLEHELRSMYHGTVLATDWETAHDGVRLYDYPVEDLPKVAG
jgi:hypothetical protein